MWIIPIVTIGLYLGVYYADIKHDLGIDKPTEQTQEKKWSYIELLIYLVKESVLLKNVDQIKTNADTQD